MNPRLHGLAFYGLAALSVSFCLAGSALAELSFKDAQTVQSVSRACVAHERQIDALLAKHPGPNLVMAQGEALSILAAAPALTEAYWAIRDRSLKMRIQDVASGRDFSAVDGRLGQADLACSGHKDMLLWKALAYSRSSRAELAAGWKKALRKRLEKPVSYAAFSQIVETTSLLVQQRIIPLLHQERQLLALRQRVEPQLRLPAQTRGAMPAISDATDRRWIDWARQIQTRAQKERELMASAQKTALELTR